MNGRNRLAHRTDRDQADAPFFWHRFLLAACSREEDFLREVHIHGLNSLGASLLPTAKHLPSRSVSHANGTPHCWRRFQSSFFISSGTFYRRDGACCQVLLIVERLVAADQRARVKAQILRVCANIRRMTRMLTLSRSASERRVSVGGVPGEHRRAEFEQRRGRLRHLRRGNWIALVCASALAVPASDPNGRLSPGRTREPLEQRPQPG